MNSNEREGNLRKQLELKGERNENLKTIDHTLRQLKKDILGSVNDMLSKLAEQIGSH